MAETFLIPGYSRSTIRPVSGFAYARENGGLLVSSRGGRESFWQGQISTGPLAQGEYAALFAQLHDAVERNLRFDLVLPRFACPRAYTPGSWPLVTVPTVEAVTDRYTLSVAGLETGMTLKCGDRFCIHQGELRSYRMVTADVTVASELAQAIPLAPRLPLGVFAPAAAVHFINPALRVAVLEESIDMPEEYRPTGATFEVVEALA